MKSHAFSYIRAVYGYTVPGNFHEERSAMDPPRARRAVLDTIPTTPPIRYTLRPNMAADS
jgi:hypothetical protein